MSRVLRLDPESPAEAAGFRALQVVADAVRGLPDDAWRIVGGWMVRAWGAEGPALRPTVDVDLELRPTKAVRLARRVPERLRAAGLRPHTEPFRFVAEGGILIDLLIAPGGSRHDPPRLGDQMVFEAEGSRLAFELAPERVRVMRGGEGVHILVPRLAGALALKTVVLAQSRPLRVRIDAQDVAILLEVARGEPEPLVADLRAHARMSDVRRMRRGLLDLFAGEGSRGTRWVAQELGERAALTAVVNARWVLAELGKRPP